MADLAIKPETLKQLEEWGPDKVRMTLNYSTFPHTMYADAVHWLSDLDAAERERVRIETAKQVEIAASAAKAAWVAAYAALAAAALALIGIVATFATAH